MRIVFLCVVVSCCLLSLPFPRMYVHSVLYVQPSTRSVRCAGRRRWALKNRREGNPLPFASCPRYAKTFFHTLNCEGKRDSPKRKLLTPPAADFYSSDEGRGRRRLSARSRLRRIPLLPSVHLQDGEAIIRLWQSPDLVQEQ